MHRFEVVVGTSRRDPEQAAKQAERKAKKAGGEQIGIAADVCCGSPGTDPLVAKLLNNIATNIFKCQCKTQEIIGQKITIVKQGVPPPPFIVTSSTRPSLPLWVVYILIRH
jgi:hypothetical protein